jgi:hypothetical protein
MTGGLPVGVTVPTQFIYTNGGPSQYQYRTATYGWYVEPRVNLHDRFFWTPGFRIDGGSNSGTSAQHNIFPRTDLSWIALDRQNTTPLFGVLSMLRPRIAFGIAGVQPGPLEQLRLFRQYTTATILPGGPGQPTTVTNIGTMGNTEIHPERARELEGGTEMYLWGDRVQLTLTGYDDMRHDAIMSVPVASSASVGYASNYYANVGDIRKRGFEVTLNTQVVDIPALLWNVNGFVSHTTNTLVRGATGGIVQGINANSGTYFTTQLVPGYPIDGIWARPILSYADINGDGLIEQNELRLGDSLGFIGSQQPKYEMTLNTSLAFFNRRLTVSTSLDYQNGMTQFLSGGTIITDFRKRAMFMLNQPGLSPGEFASIVAGDGGATLAGLAQTVSVLRWNSFSVDYQVPSRLSQRVRIPNLSLAVRGSNLALHTNYRGKDPNVSAISTGNYIQDSGQLPPPRLLTFSVRIGN